MKRFRTISTMFIVVIAVIFCCNVYYLISLYNSIRANVERDVMTALADADIDDMWERADRANRAAIAAKKAYLENGDSIIEGHGQVSGVKDEDGNFVTTSQSSKGETRVNKTPLRRDRSYTNQMVNDMSHHRAYMTPLTRHILSQMLGVIVTVFLLMTSFTLAFWYLFRTVSRLRTIEEMKDDFVSNMTHELKTPIAIAYSANDALINYDTANDPAKKTKYLMIANKQLKRLGELVENILAMSMERRKTMKLQPETIQLQPFVEEIAAAQRMRGEKEITINVSVDDDVSIEADKEHLSNILNNLIDNAIKYSRDSVAITISGNEKEISVADNGIGIPAKSMPYLFNKFYHVPHGNRQDVRGYGIGLYYVKSILGKMGWNIDVKSKEKEGSVFTIKISNDGQ